MPSTNVKRILAGSGALVGLLAAFHLVEGVRGHLAWSRVREARRSQGLPATHAGYAPEPVPEAENFAAVPMIASAITGRKPGWGVSFTGIGPAWDAKWFGDWRAGKCADVAGNEKEIGKPLETALAPYGPMLDALAQASLRPKSRLLLPYTGEEEAIPAALGFRAVVRTLASRALGRLHAGRNAEAFEDLATCLRVARHLEPEPHLSIQFLRMAWLGITFQPLWEGIQGHRFNEPQLAALQGHLEALEVLGPWRKAIHADRQHFEEYAAAHTPGWWAQLKAGQHWSVQEDRTLGRAEVLARTLLLPRGWYLQNQARMEDVLIQRALAPLDPEHHRVQAALAREAEAGVRGMKRTPYTFLIPREAPMLYGQTSRLARLQVSLDEARVACALERYRLAHKGYPEDLQALVGPWLRAMPQDAMTGTPLHYLRTAEGGYRLWSVGWGGQDLGGATGPDTKDATQGNWAWVVAR